MRLFWIFYFILCMAAFPIAKAQAEETQTKQTFAGTIYDEPTLAKLARLFWRLGKFDTVENPMPYVDSYLRINECNLFREFAHNELEWNQIKKTTYEFLKTKRNDFSKNFSLVVPINLTEYDEEKEAFGVLSENNIINSRSFEIKAVDFGRTICGLQNDVLHGYPQGLYVELNRPFNFNSVPMTKEQAEAYIKLKTPKYLAIKEEHRSKGALYKTRDAYLVMKVKIYYYMEDIELSHKESLAKVMAVLDRYEVYQDEKMRTLLFAKDINVKKSRSPIEEKLKKQYQERLKTKTP